MPIVTDIEYTAVELPTGTTRPVIIFTMYSTHYEHRWKQAFYLSNGAVAIWTEVNDRLPLAEQLPPDF